MAPCTVYYFLPKRFQNGMVEGLFFFFFFVKIVIYDRNKIPNSKDLFFCEAVFGNCGAFCLLWV